MNLQIEVTTLAWCWKLKPKTGEVLGFTSSDVDLHIDDITFLANSGFTPSSIYSSNKLNVDNLDIEGMLDSKQISEHDILSGKLDHAELEIFMINYHHPKEGKLSLRTGWLGEISLSRNQFITEVRGLMQTLSQTIGELYSPTCRARFGDMRCKVDIKAYTHQGIVKKVLGLNKFIDDSLQQKNGYFDCGVIKFQSGQSFEVISYFNHTIELFSNPYFEVLEGAKYEIISGCDKHLDTCKYKFNNVINFRGEPHIPTFDKLTLI